VSGTTVKDLPSVAPASKGYRSNLSIFDFVDFFFAFFYYSDYKKPVYLINSLLSNQIKVGDIRISKEQSIRSLYTRVSNQSG
jgi:hypothetical protein